MRRVLGFWQNVVLSGRGLRGIICGLVGSGRGMFFVVWLTVIGFVVELNFGLEFFVLNHPSAAAAAPSLFFKEGLGNELGVKNPL